MYNNKENSKRIVKNALILYIRLLLSMLIVLYTSRVILNTLGIEDYGIYNVICGVIVMIACLNDAMTGATQRFITFELGKKKQLNLNNVFSTSILIHILIATLFLILSESVGLWFISNKLVIPTDRMDAAVFIFHISLFSTFIQILSIPFKALIIAHEKMTAFSCIFILDIALKLLIIYPLSYLEFDKLKMYAFLMFCVSVVIGMINYLYSRTVFKQVRFHLYFDKPLFSEMLSFASVNLIGNLSYILFTQGLNIMLNVFFGPLVNAARGIAMQVQGAVSSFGGSFQTAVNPQITKSYAESNFSYLYILIIASSKYTFFLLYLLAFPILVETDAVLIGWLKLVPPHSVQFIRIVLFITIVMVMANPITVAVHATGKIKVYQFAVGGLHLLILPLSYFLLKLDFGPKSVFIVNLIVVLIAFFVRIKILSSLIFLSVNCYIKQVLFPVLSVIIVSFAGLFILKSIILISSFLMLFVSVVIVVVSIVVVGLNKKERLFIAAKIKNIYKYGKTSW